eukprot:Sspe_Gene.20842::Locus_7692_Transcript_1_1_Confidence_1.000_Length_1439::g.20842::m.20842
MVGTGSGLAPVFIAHVRTHLVCDTGSELEGIAWCLYNLDGAGCFSRDGAEDVERGVVTCAEVPHNALSVGHPNAKLESPLVEQVEVRFHAGDHVLGEVLCALDSPRLGALLRYPENHSGRQRVEVDHQARGALGGLEEDGEEDLPNALQVAPRGLLKELVVVKEAHLGHCDVLLFKPLYETGFFTRRATLVLLSQSSSHVAGVLEVLAFPFIVLLLFLADQGERGVRRPLLAGRIASGQEGGPGDHGVWKVLFVLFEVLQETVEGCAQLVALSLVLGLLYQQTRLVQVVPAHGVCHGLSQDNHVCHLGLLAVHRHRTVPRHPEV